MGEEAARGDPSRGPQSPGRRPLDWAGEGLAWLPNAGSQGGLRLERATSAAVGRQGRLRSEGWVGPWGAGGRGRRAGGRRRGMGCEISKPRPWSWGRARWKQGGKVPEDSWT